MLGLLRSAWLRRRAAPIAPAEPGEAADVGAPPAIADSSGLAPRQPGRLAAFAAPLVRRAPSLPELTSVLFSLVGHVAVVLLLGAWYLPSTWIPPQKIMAEWAPEADLLEELPEPELQLAPVSASEKDSIWSAAVQSEAFATTDAPNLDNVIQPVDEPTPLAVAELDLPEAIALTKDGMVHYGTAGEAVANVEGAVDRITHEIAVRLER
jgi:hypothetical protein